MKNRKIITKSIIEYIILFYLYVTLPAFIALKIKGSSDLSELLSTYIGNIIFLVIILIIFFKRFKKDLPDLKKNFGKYMELSIKYWAIGLGIMMLSNFILNMFVFSGNIATNEAIVRDYMFNTPILSLLSICFIAPIVEEVMFRISFRRMFGKNDKLYIIMSGVLFGFLHAISNGSWVGLLYIIPYGALGSAFAYIYTKTDNIYCSILMHMLHNTMTFILIILAYSSLGAS